MKFRSCMTRTNTTFCLHNLACDISRLRRTRQNHGFERVEINGPFAAALLTVGVRRDPGKSALGPVWPVQSPAVAQSEGSLSLATRAHKCLHWWLQCPS